MTGIFNGKSCIDVEKAGENESVGSETMEGKSNATHNTNNNIGAKVYKSSGEDKTQEIIQKVRDEKEAVRQVILKNLDVFYSKQDIIEVRIFHKDGSKFWGYYLDKEALAKDVIVYDFRKDIKGIFVTLNPVNNALLARSINQIKSARKDTKLTSDEDISKRKWLFIDIDPKRPTQISSTYEEHENAKNIAIKVRDYLTSIVLAKSFP